MDSNARKQYQSPAFPKRVFVITKWNKEKPEFMMPVAVKGEVLEARRYIQSQPGFSAWLNGVPRIANCGEELFEYTEFEVD